MNFIKLTDSEDNTTIYVKKKALSAVCPIRGLPQIMHPSKASILR